MTMNGGEFVVKSRRSTVARIEERKDWQHIFGLWPRVLPGMAREVRLVTRARCLESGKRVYSEAGAHDAVHGALRDGLRLKGYVCSHCGEWHLSTVVE
jgi:hypothetical protein